jgi:hypothetical protein
MIRYIACALFSYLVVGVPIVLFFHLGQMAAFFVGIICGGIGPLFLARWWL